MISVVSRLSGLEKLALDCPAESLGAGDVILLETPVNPLGVAFNIEEFAAKAHARGAYLIVDSTFAPPGLQDPFLWGADIVMHSGSKYFGGHSDLLCGVLATKRDDWAKQLFEDRIALGNVIGNLESWLGNRSLRTLDVRVQRASQNSAKLISWLHQALNTPSPVASSEKFVVQKVLQKIHHASFSGRAVVEEADAQRLWACLCYHPATRRVHPDPSEQAELLPARDKPWWCRVAD